MLMKNMCCTSETPAPILQAQSQPNVASLWQDNTGTSVGKKEFQIHLLRMFFWNAGKLEFRREPARKGLVTRA